MKRKRPIPPEQISAEIEELKMQINAIHTENNKDRLFFLTDAEIIARAILEVAYLRAKERIQRLKNRGAFGWVCGTHTSSLRRAIETRLKIMYTSEQLNQIITYCDSRVYDDNSAECVNNHFIQIWELIPNLHVNIYFPDYSG